MRQMILLVRIDISIVVLSIFGHILLNFMEIFQDVPFPNLEFNLFQVILVCFNINYVK